MCLVNRCLPLHPSPPNVQNGYSQSASLLTHNFIATLMAFGYALTDCSCASSHEVCFCVIGEFEKLSYNTKKISEKRILINTFSEISYSPAVFSAFFSKYNTSQFSIPCPTCINYFASAQKFSWTKPGAGNCEYNRRNGYTPYCWDSSTRQDPSCRLSDIFRRRCTGSRRSDIDRRQSDERGRRSRPVDTDIYKTDDKLSRTVQPVPRV